MRIRLLDLKAIHHHQLSWLAGQTVALFDWLEYRCREMRNSQQPAPTLALKDTCNLGQERPSQTQSGFDPQWYTD